MKQGIWTDEVIERFFAYADHAGHGQYSQYFSDVSGCLLYTSDAADD